MTEDIIIRREGAAGRITLNRPKALNSLTEAMLRAIDDALERWRHDDAVALVIIDAAGERAFAAGGDIVDLYNTGRAGDFGFGQRFWAYEYGLNARIARYPKPYVAFMQGFTMGGGVGVSAHGSHRIVCESSQVAMPECGIGLVPDVGGSKLLADAPGRAGEFLGMTGTRMGPADAIHAGFADIYAPETMWEEIKRWLCETGDPGVIAEAAETPPPGTLPETAAMLEAAFSAPTAEAVEAALAADDRAEAQAALKALRRNCPLSVACALQMIRAARDMTLEQALAQEYRFTARCMEHGEFLEGIRAAVIDKDRRPHWAKPTLAEIGAEDISAMLAPLGEYELIF